MIEKEPFLTEVRFLFISAIIPFSCLSGTRKGMIWGQFFSISDFLKLWKLKTNIYQLFWSHTSAFWLKFWHKQAAKAPTALCCCDHVTPGLCFEIYLPNQVNSTLFLTRIYNYEKNTIFNHKNNYQNKNYNSSDQ